MANVLVAFYNFARDKNNYIAMPPFYEGFVHGMRDAGNNVFCFFHKNYNYDFSRQIEPELLTGLTKFNPDIAIYFNNNFYDVTRYFDIPTIIYDVDSPTSFKNKKIIFENKTYKFITMQSSEVKIIREYYRIKRDKIEYIEPFTSIKGKNKTKVQRNIGYIGANMTWSGAKSVLELSKNIQNPEDRKKALRNLFVFSKNPYERIDDTYASTNLHMVENHYEFMHRLSGIRRQRHLASIADLGLEIRGYYWDHENMKYFPELALSFNPEPVFGIADSEKFYNSSRICPNISHIQATSGFSWRVLDVLASSACLITEKKKDLQAMFGKIVPTFSSEYGLRRKCVHLLKHEDERRDIVKECNKIVDEKYRFGNMLKKIEEFLSMKLHGEKRGEIQYFHDLMLAQPH